MQELLKNTLLGLGHHPLALYGCGAFITFLDAILGVGYLMPTMIVVIFLGVMSARGGVDLLTLEIVLSLGAFTGDVLMFHLGLAEHHSLVLGARGKKTLARGKKFVKKYGETGLLISKFIVPLRSVIPFVSGLYEKPRGRFYHLDLFASMMWIGIYLLIGFFA